jgi:hypothetical protein
MLFLAKAPRFRDRLAAAENAFDLEVEPVEESEA